MNGQCGVVPGRSIRELVVGQQVSSGLRLGQVLEPDDRDFGALIEFRRLVAAMAGYDLLVPVDQNRRVEAEGGDAAGDRPDLLAAVLARILSSMIGRRANRPHCDGAAPLTENFSFKPDFNLEFAISDIDRAFCDAACEAVISGSKCFENLLDSQRT